MTLSESSLINEPISMISLSIAILFLGISCGQQKGKDLENQNEERVSQEKENEETIVLLLHGVLEKNSENYMDYKQLLIKRAQQHLANKSSSKS